MIKQRARTIEWCEKKIIHVLSKRCHIVTHLALEAHVLENVRSTQEDRHFHRALTHLLNTGVVKQEATQDGYALFRLVK